ncbi:MAG: hypothetical protein ABFS41_02085 [Myxococcota bacterium]
MTQSRRIARPLQVLLVGALLALAPAAAWSDHHEGSNPCAAKAENPCAAEAENPCAAKAENPCAAKGENPCAAKGENPCGGEQSE